MAKNKMTKMPTLPGQANFNSRAMRPGETDVPNPAPGVQRRPSLGSFKPPKPSSAAFKMSVPKMSKGGRARGR